MAETPLVISIVANVALTLANAGQAFVAFRAKQHQTTNAALKDENDSLRRQLDDLRKGHVQMERKEAERAKALEGQLTEGHQAWQRQQIEQQKVFERGANNVDGVVRSALAAAEVAQDKCLKRIDQVIETTKVLAADDLKLSHDEVETILNSRDPDVRERAVMDLGRSMRTLMMMNVVRAIAEEGMQFCGRMCLLEAAIISRGQIDPDKSIEHEIRDFLDERPVYTTKNEFGEDIDVHVTMADIEKRWQFWRDRAAARKAVQQR